MVDTNPLLSEKRLPPSPTKNPKYSLDEKIEKCIGDFGWKPFFQATLVSLSWIFDAQLTFISVFTDANPSWHCTSEKPGNNICTTAGAGADVCRLPRESWSWDLPPHTSIVSEWSLECSGSFVTGLPASSFFLGCLLGGLLLSTLADSCLGRKNMLTFSVLLMSVAGFLTVFSTNVWTYAALKFVCGFGRATIGTCALVLATELVGKRWRGQIGVLGFVFFTCGFLSLPLIAYSTRGSSWRLLYLWTCIPSIFYCFVLYFLVRESPRWLYIRGRKTEFLAALKSISTSENMSFSGSSLDLPFCSSNNDQDIISTLRIFWEKTWIFRRLAAIMTVGFGNGLVYYGMPLALGGLDFNLYWSATLNALSELPASLVVFLLIGKLNRKTLIFGFSLISCFSSLICYLIGNYNYNYKYNNYLEIGLELVSFFSADTAFNVILIYTMELFPTCVRNSAVSMVRQAAVLGGTISPILGAAGRKNKLYSFGVFGATIGVSSLFVGCLPETKGGTFCDTIDEEEEKAQRAAAYNALLLVNNNNNNNIV